MRDVLAGPTPGARVQFQRMKLPIEALRLLVGANSSDTMRLDCTADFLAWLDLGTLPSTVADRYWR